MTGLEYLDNYGASALDQQQELDRQQGYAVVPTTSGLGTEVEPTINTGTLGTGNNALSVAAGDVLFGGTTTAVSSQNVDIDTGDTNPRKDVVYIDGTGTAVVKKGSPNSIAPSGSTGFNTFSPAPYPMNDIDGVVIAEVYVAANATSIGSGDLRDRRLPADVDVNQLDAISVSTGQLLGVADRIIRDSDDAQSIIESGSMGDVFWLEPGASFDLNSTFTPPQNVALLSNGGRIGDPGVTFTKQFNGTMMNVPTGLYMRSIRFDGNKQSGYTGDGLVDTTNGVKENYWQWVHVVSNAGDNRVMDGHYFSTYDGCRFSSADGWGIKHVQSGGSEVSQNTYRGRSQISKNGAGGVKYQDCYVHAESHDDVVVASNNGDAYYLQCDSDAMEFWGNVEGNDGASFLFDEKSDGTATAHKGPSIGGRVQNAWQDPTQSNFSNSGSRVLGEVSIQGTAGVDTLNWDGKISGSTNADTPYSDYGDRRSNANIRVNRTDSGYADDCRVNSTTRAVMFYTDITNGTVANSSSVTDVVYKIAAGGVNTLA